MMTFLVFLIAEASFLAERFYSVKRGQRDGRFWKFTWLIGILIAASTLTPIIQSHSDEMNRIEAVKKRIFNELKINVEILTKWRVILNKQFSGVEILKMSMYVSGSLDLPDTELEKKLREVYMQTEDLDRRLNDYRGTGLGYQNTENTRRVKNSLESLIKSTTVVLNEIDESYTFENSSDEEVIQKNIVQFRDGIATGNTISADSGQPAASSLQT